MLDSLGPPEVSEVISGMATGADTLAAEWAERFGFPLRKFPADWKAHGRAAGPIRNQRMIDEGRPDLVIAFPGGRGTADMVRRAKAAGIEVREM
ncbi:SLOG family protein [Kaistia adipata]|uniref:SLOG family protein n=1 Tax=Kaistia adipata TaxID=166954 RepID=UPI0003F7AE9F|nr:SLOG family protein [Kaistia adipata]